MTENSALRISSLPPTIDVMKKTPYKLKNYEKWSEVPPTGVPIHGILPMKLLNNWNPSAGGYFHNVENLVTKHPTVRLIMDLQNEIDAYTTEGSGVERFPMRLVSKQYPDLESIGVFTDKVKSFLESSPEDTIVAVHCHYGFNRTGFVVCSFLIEQYGIGVSDAIHQFSVARPPGIRHQHYRDELHRRYDPDWVEPVSSGAEGDDVASSSTTSSSYASLGDQNSMVRVSDVTPVVVPAEGDGEAVRQEVGGKISTGGEGGGGVRDEEVNGNGGGLTLESPNSDDKGISSPGRRKRPCRVKKRGTFLKHTGPPIVTVERRGGPKTVGSSPREWFRKKLSPLLSATRGPASLPPGACPSLSLSSSSYTSPSLGSSSDRGGVTSMPSLSLASPPPPPSSAPIDGGGGFPGSV